MSPEFYFYKDNNRLKRLLLPDIVFFEAAGNYVNIYCHSGKITVRRPLETVMLLLPHGYFVQIHRSYAVAINSICAIEKDLVRLYAEPAIELPVSRVYYSELMVRLTVLDTAVPAFAKKIPPQMQGDNY